MGLRGFSSTNYQRYTLKYFLKNIKKLIQVRNNNDPVFYELSAEEERGLTAVSCFPVWSGQGRRTSRTPVPSPQSPTHSLGVLVFVFIFVLVMAFLCLAGWMVGSMAHWLAGWLRLCCRAVYPLASEPGLLEFSFQHCSPFAVCSFLQTDARQVSVNTDVCCL